MHPIVAIKSIYRIYTKRNEMEIRTCHYRSKFNYTQRKEGKRKRRIKSYKIDFNCLVSKSCLTLCNTMDCRPPASSVHRISQARRLEWVAISFSRGSSWPRDQTRVSCIGRQILYCWVTREPPTAHKYRKQQNGNSNLFPISNLMN